MHRLGLCVAVSLLAACTSDAATPDTTALHRPDALEANASLVRVVDGDTIVASIDGRDERVRLIGIDTPETVKEDTPGRVLRPGGVRVHRLRCCRRARRCAWSATSRHATTTTDCSPTSTARATGCSSTSRSCAQGYATPLTFPPNVAHADEFVAAARDAEAADGGPVVRVPLTSVRDAATRR